MNNKIILLSIIIISSLAKNKPMIFAGIIVLILSFLNKYYDVKLDKNIFLNTGLTLLMIWMLIPIMEGGGSPSTFKVKNYLNMDVLVSFLSGLFVVTIASKGLNLLNNNPSILTGILTGSIIGVTFFGGVPVGMLTGSGIAYLVIKILKAFIPK